MQCFASFCTGFFFTKKPHFCHFLPQKEENKKNLKVVFFCFRVYDPQRGNPLLAMCGCNIAFLTLPSSHCPLVLE